MPFEIFAESIDPFVIEDNGYNYSSTGVRFYFKRKKLGLLIGSFYGPMAVFAALSMLSYNINVDAVSINSTNMYVYLKKEKKILKSKYLRIINIIMQNVLCELTMRFMLECLMKCR